MPWPCIKQQQKEISLISKWILLLSFVKYTPEKKRVLCGLSIDPLFLGPLEPFFAPVISFLSPDQSSPLPPSLISVINKHSSPSTSCCGDTD